MNHQSYHETRRRPTHKLFLKSGFDLVFDFGFDLS